jgi:ATP-dependent DNA helicase RecQ
MGERHVKTILAWLHAAGAIDRRQGRFGRGQDFASAADLGRFLDEHERRLAADRERLAAMTHYAETTECRARYLRRYFGEAEGETCGHCDNCRDRPAEQLASPEPVHAAPPLASVVPTGIDGPTGGAPPPSPPPFAAGEVVRHRQFGLGTVMTLDGEKVTVAFTSAGEKVVQVSYLAPAHQPQEA